MLPRCDLVSRDEIVRQTIALGIASRAGRHGVRIHCFAIRQQFEREDVDLLLGLLALANHVAEIVMRETRLYAITRVIA